MSETNTNPEARDVIERTLRLSLRAPGARAAATDAIIAALAAEGMKILKNTTYQERSWPGDAGDENGNYHCECVTCLRRFRGYKRRVVCRACAAPTLPPAGDDTP